MNTLNHVDASVRPSRPWCLFQVAGKTYAIGLESVVEVVEIERLVRFPHSPPRVLGLCTLRREVLPVVGLDPSETADRLEGGGQRLVLILRTSQGNWAIQVSAEGTSVAEGVLEGPSPLPGSNAPWLTFQGFVRRGETSCPVIDPEAMWKHVRGGVESYYAGRWVDDIPAQPASRRAACSA
ncbi:MAG: chemotaxis protein CheW [Isosphaeraceae bacterium]